MPLTNETATRADAIGVWCVLWVPPGSAVPPALFKVLEQRRLSVVTVHHRFGAIAQLVRAHASVTPKALCDPSAGGVAKGPILVFVEPEELDGAGEVFKTLELSAPNTLCWRYRQASVPKLGMFLVSELPDRLANTVSPTACSDIVIMPGLVPMIREPKAMDPPPLSLAGSGPDDPTNESGGFAHTPHTNGHSTIPAATNGHQSASHKSEAISGRSPPPLRLTPREPDHLKSSPETSDHHGRHEPLRPAPIRPRERDDFSRIITEDELTMLLDDRKPNG